MIPIHDFESSRLIVLDTVSESSPEIMERNQSVYGCYLLVPFSKKSVSRFLCSYVLFLQGSTVLLACNKFETVRNLRKK